MENFFDNKRIFNSIWKWKTHIVIIVSIAIVVSAIISGPIFIKPKFKSTARVYPMNIDEASEESESEHLLEFLMSIDIKFRLIDAFRLDEVYKINRDDKLYKTYILYQYNQNIKYKKTDLETIEISVMDVDPNRAAQMADSLIVFLNESILQQKNKRYLEWADRAKTALERKNMELDSLFNIIENIRKETGLVDYKAQAESATLGLLEAAARGGDRKPAQEAMKQLVDKGGQLRKYQELIIANEVLADTLQRRYDKAMLFGMQNITFTQVVERPYPADKKAYPIRWLIVLLSAFAAGFISIVMVSLIDYIREDKSTL
ncbi:MAG TPA: Wzz/FepE/Etk N-terminal domain-containing protein [Prolixibacteraceae bacterium]|nr:Wzz/FepE/Etk N-terminal domain-containing protein [Prolixibacteraceae bacterium]